ncbi:MAG TPA: hypothetical protein QF564_33460 [Pirellulaceae bacterium]|nr:hypothetical protein [Pirellulaceae bacterium]
MRVPAIDPTGTRIFAPATTTTVFPTAAPGQGHSFFPRPAFTEPPIVPPCPEASTVIGPMAPIGTGVPPCPVIPGTEAVAFPRAQDRLIVSPMKMVAPIGTEVVLLGGICGPRGYYVTKQPVEWTMSQESVGNIVDVNKTGHSNFAKLLDKAPNKLSSNFAIAHTSSSAHWIDRGTPDPNDDVWLRKGQSWITITSPSEGVSYISAVATGAENWEQRRQTARVHWVDAQWALPGPAVVRAGQRHTLTTNVTRASSGEGAQHWLVRYEIISGPDVVFEANGQKTIEVNTDTKGAASADLLPRTAGPGTTQVRVQILTPRDTIGSPENVPVGTGFTTVTWSAPGLTVQTSGPATVAVGATLRYLVEVTNPGDLPAEDTIMVAEIPVLMKYLGSTPPPSQELTRQLRWQLGNLGPRETHRFEVRCRADGAGDQRLHVRADADGGVSAESSVSTRVVQSALGLRVLDPPTTAKVGERVHFNIEVSNTGDQPVSNVIIRDQFDAGLRHTGGERSPIERAVGDLGPGDVRQIGVSFIIQRAGQHCHTVEVAAAGGHAASLRACVDATEPRRSVVVEVTGPEQRTAGESAIYKIRVTNTGEAELTTVKLLAVPDASLTPTAISPGVRYTQEGLLWDIPSLKPGETTERRIQCTCDPPNAQAEMAVRVTTGQAITAADTTTTTIQAAPVVPLDEPPPRIDDVPPTAPVSGTLKISMAETEDPIGLGQKTTYIIELKNDRNIQDRNVEVTFHLPEGLKYEGFVSLSADLSISISDDNRIVRVERISEMRPGGTRMFRIGVVGRQVGPWPFRVEVSSLRTPQPIAVVEETMVNEN